jgi:hypothetical protein
MDLQLRNLLELLIKLTKTVNDEILRLSMTEQFTESPECTAMIEDIRNNYAESLQNLDTIQRRLFVHALLPPNEGDKK